MAGSSYTHLRNSCLASNRFGGRSGPIANQSQITGVDPNLPSVRLISRVNQEIWKLLIHQINSYQINELLLNNINDIYH